MPYSGPDDPKLPDHVKKMSDKKKRQWVHVFNSAMDDHDEKTAFAMANGVSNKAYIESYDIYGRQLEQNKANYSAVGGNNEKACANCNWFVSPDGCILVGGTISPTGISNLWMEKVEQYANPIPVTIVEDESEEHTATPSAPSVQAKSIIDHVLDFAKGLLGKKEEEKPVFTLFKDENDNLRFFAMPSNMFQDRHGHIITSAAHKDFVNWVDTTKIYPELWIWHIPGSRIGRTDWLEFTEDGMLCASGIVDKEFESVAESLVNKDIAMSHGFFRFSELPNIDKYRAFELSILPRPRAANFGTDFMLEQKEMAFSDEKRKLLVDSGVTEDQIKQWEEGAEKFGQQMKQMGVAWKEEEEKETTTENAQIITAMSTLIDKVTSMEATLNQRVEAVEKSFDDKIAEAYTAKVDKVPQGHTPSSSEGNIIEPGAQQNKEHEETNNWFYNEVVAKVGK